MKQKFIELQVQLMAAERSENDEFLGKLTEERLRIEANEPPVLRVLYTLCHNELARAMGYGPKEQIDVSFWQRRFAPFFDIGEHNLGKNQDPRVA